MASLRRSTFGLIALDAVAVVLCFNLAMYLRGIPGGLVVTPLLVPMLVSMLAIYLVDGYKSHTDMMSVDYTSQHSIALLAALVITVLLTFVIVPSGYELQSSRIVILLSYAGLIPITLSYRRVVYARASRALRNRRVVFLGDAASCRDFAAEHQKMGSTFPIVYSLNTGILSGYSTPPMSLGVGTELRPIAEVLDEIDAGRLPVEAIVLRESSSDLPEQVSQRLMQLFFRGVPTYTLELFHQIYWNKIPLYRLNHTWLFQEGFRIAREPVFERFKRATDLLLAGIALVLVSPLLLLCAIAIKLDDRGPVFFTQTRIGKNRRPFRIIKLRTMQTGGAEGNRYTQPGDSRITRVGRLLRTTRLDEFPQLWNVLRGEMSMIGPRAEWDQLVQQYEREIPCYHFRHLVKPGITGWAQVNYPYGANLEDTVRKLEYDLYYIRHFSFMLDAAIVLKTIHTMLFGRGR